ncbi:MAG: DUF3108 domain-containing protein [Nitrosomonas sp.]|nr:DUF3108 domain-containing protein [Nitrosomonas sp.]
MKLLLLILLFWLTGIAHGADLPTRFELEYTLKGSIGRGKVSQTFSIEQQEHGRHYQITSEVRASGLLSLVKSGSIVLHSTGVIQQDNLQPLLFTDQRGDKPVREVTFDRQQQRIVYRRKGREMVVRLPDKTQDKLSFMYHFMFAGIPQATISIHETDHRRLQSSRYTVSEEVLATPIGEFSTVVLTRQPAPDDPHPKKVWLARDHFLLPLRIISVESNGLEVDQLISAIRYNSNGRMQTLVTHATDR